MHHKEKDFRFEKRAEKYDGFEGKLSTRFYRLLLEQVELGEGALVLDVGCGTGALLYRMEAMCPIEGHGIDMEAAMIAEAQKKCPHMDIRVSSCKDTPFADNTFDIITACMAYHHFSDQEGFAREAARILKPGGRVYIADPRFPFVIRKAINGIARLFCMAGNFGTPEEIYRPFKKYGFVLKNVAVSGYAQAMTLRLE